MAECDRKDGVGARGRQSGAARAAPSSGMNPQRGVSFDPIREIGLCL
jgi:hypothetical protein